MRKHPIGIALLLISGAGPLSAQVRLDLPSTHSFALFRPFPTSTVAPATRPYPATYYFEGAVIGAGVWGSFGALLAYDLGCESDRAADCGRAGPIVAGGVVGALLGGTVGALAGGLLPAPHRRPLRGNPVKAAVIGGCAGALWGFGPFSHFCLNGCHKEEVVLGVSTTAVGALSGFLVGH